MDPLSRVTKTPILRAGDLSSQPEAKELLRVGRVLLGTVSQRDPGPGLQLLIGRQKFPLDPQFLVNPGEKYLVRVESQNGEILLRLLGAEASAPSPILDALRGVLGESRPIGELLQELAQRLNAEVENPGSAWKGLGQLSGALAGEVPGKDVGGAELKQLVQNSGLRYEALLARAVKEGLSPEQLDRLRSNLKGQLLDALAQLERGPLQKAVSHTLAGLEAEQLLNVARQSAGEPLFWSFPFPDLEGWTTARLVMDAPPQDADEHESSGAKREAGDVTRIALGISFSQLGPVRAEFSLEPEVLRIAIYVTNEDLADQIRGDFDVLMKRLGDGKRSLQLSTSVRTPEEVNLHTEPGEVRFLEGKHLLDLEG